MATVLIIEDDIRITKALTVRLTSAGYAVLTADDGFKGLKTAVAHRPDLIVMDVVMPVGLGFSVAERLQSMNLRMPIVFLTASKRTGLRKMAQKLGAAGFFEKPYDSQELLAAIALILGSTSHAAPQLQLAPDSVQA